MEEPAKPCITSKDEESPKIAETKSYEIFLENDEYELTMNLYDISFIEFKLIQRNIIPSFYYIEKYNLENINKISYLFYKDLKEVFQFYNKIIEKKKVKLIYLKDKDKKIYLNFKNIINLDEVVEANVELKEIKLSKDEIFQELIKEVIKLKKQKNTKKPEEEKKIDIKNEIKLSINNFKKEYDEKYKNLENKILLLEKKIIENEKKIVENEKKNENKIKKNEHRRIIRES